MRSLATLIIVLCVARLSLQAQREQPAPPPTTLEDAKADLQSLFEQYGQIDEDQTWSFTTDDTIRTVRNELEESPILRNLEDWSFLTPDPCTIWLTSVKGAIKSTYKIPLAKLTAHFLPFSSCPVCSGYIDLGTVENQRAIKEFTIYSFGSYRLANINDLFVGLSSERLIKQAADDLVVGIKACHQ